MRETSSTVISNATGGHAAMACEIGFGRACSTLAVTEAATPTVSVSRCRCRQSRPPWWWRVWTPQRIFSLSIPWDPHIADGEWTMMACRAATTGVPGRDKRVRDAAAVTDGRPWQGRGDLGVAPSDHGAAAPARQREGRASIRPTGPTSRRCCTGSPATCCVGCDCWSAPRP